RGSGLLRLHPVPEAGVLVELAGEEPRHEELLRQGRPARGRLAGRRPVAAVARCCAMPWNCSRIMSTTSPGIARTMPNTNTVTSRRVGTTRSSRFRPPGPTGSGRMPRVAMRQVPTSGPLTLPSPRRGEGQELFAEEVAAGVEEADEGQLLGGRRGEPAERGGDTEVPAAGLARGLDRGRLRHVAVEPGQGQLAVLGGLLVHAQVRDRGAHGSTRRGD